MKRFKQKSTYVSLAISALLAAGSAVAEIEEITVTANKREQSLQDVPLTVSVTSEATIKQSSIVDLIDLQSAVPSLRVNQLQSSAQTNFVIRGFGNGANNPGIEPAVLVLIDGVPRSRSSSSLADLPTIERVEVLSGPQSTLFGKNASAGVISITTKAPGDEMGGLLEATLGSNGAEIVKGTVTSPLTENLSIRLSASSNERDGLGTNLSDNSPINDRNRSAVRGQIAWNPSEDLSVRVIADSDKINEVCCVTGPLLRGPASDVSDGIALQLQEAGLPGVGVLAPDATPWDRQIYMNFEPYNDVENEGISLHIEKDLGFATLTSITSDRETNMRSNFDADFSAARLINENKLDYDFETFTQELRLTSNGDSDVQWTVGAFYADEDTYNNRTVLYGDDIETYVDFLLSGAGSSLDAVAELVAQGALVQVFQGQGLSEADAQVQVGTLLASPGGMDAVDTALATAQAAGAPVMTSAQMRGQFFNVNGGSQQEEFNMSSKTTSIFANVDFPVAEDWTASIGVNKTDDEKTVVADVIIDDLFASLPLPSSLTAFQFFPPFVNYPNDDGENGVFKSDDVTHTLRLTHDLSDNTKVYASHSTGFKPTSVNLSVNANDATKRAALPEFSENIEIGMKHTHDAGYINLALFDQTIEGFQSNTFVGNGFQLVNAGNQKHRGIELDSMTALSESWVVGFSAMILDPEYVSFVNGPCDSSFATIACDEDKVTKDLSGSAPAGVHDLSVNANAVYSFDLSDTVSSYLRLEYVYESDVQLVENVPADIASRSTKNLNMSMGFNHAPSNMEVMFWGRNLTDHESLISAFPTTAAPGSFGGYPNEPRTYGLTLRSNF
jgi:outer membrane receptor protein involved in Fe transport